jgi:small subunit ribosomal protein S1
VGDGIEGLVHISEMSAHHVDLPDQVVTPGEELWVKIIDLDLQRRRISLSIKQAAEGGEVAEEYREHFGEHAYDDEGNYIGPEYDTSSYEEAWEQYEQSQGEGTADAGADAAGGDAPGGDTAGGDTAGGDAAGGEAEAEAGEPEAEPEG